MPHRSQQTTSQILRKWTSLELDVTSASISSLSKLLALNYFDVVPIEANRDMSFRDWRGLPEDDADKAKHSNYKLFERMLAGATRIPVDLYWPWVNMLDIHRDQCLAEMNMTAGYQMFSVEPSRNARTLGPAMRHFSDILGHYEEILKDGKIDHLDIDAIESLLVSSNQAIGALAGISKHFADKLSEIKTAKAEDANAAGPAR